MNNKIILICFLFLTACNNEPKSIVSKEKASDISSNDEITNQPLHNIQGYKEFKFGMSSSEIAKLKACEKSYRYFSDLDRLPGLIEDAKSKLSIDRNESNIKFYQKRIEEAESTIQSSEKQYREPNSIAESARQPLWQLQSTIQRMNQNLLEYRQKLAELQEQSQAESENPQIRYDREVQPLIDKLELAKKYDLSITNNWLRQSQSSCVTEIMGLTRNLQFSVYPDSGLLAKISIHLGEYKDEVFHAIAKSLAEKYVVSNVPDETQIKMFNEVGLERVYVTYADGQVMLIATNYRSYRGNERDMELVYADRNTADQLNKQINKGKVNVNDL